METEKSSHETEKSLTLSQISATQQTETLLTKKQNGDQSPDILSQQFNGDTNWSHFKPSTEVFSMKRLQENCGSPANMQGMFDQSMYEMNGDVKHALGEQAFQEYHQPKKHCTDLEMNGDEHNKQGHSEINNIKRNCNFPNGDIFLMSRNKQVPITNGATKNPHSVKGTTGDLLEKTLSQYYPEHVSIAPQTNSSQVHQVNMPEQATPSPSFTSGFPISPQTSASKPFAKVPPEVQSSNGYHKEFTQNGYYGSATADQQQRKSTFLLSNHPEVGKPSVCQAGLESNVSSQTGMNGFSHIQKDGEGLPNDTQCLGMFSKSNQDFGQESYMLPRGSPLLTKRDGTLTSFNSHQAQNTQTGQQNLEFKMSKEQSTDERFQEIRDLSFTQQQAPESQTAENRLLSQAASQNQSSEHNDRAPPGQKKMTSQSANQSTQMDWIDLNSAPVPPSSNKHPHTFFHSQPAQMQQIQQSQSQVINHVSPNSFQSLNYSKSTFATQESPTQDCYKHSQPPTQLPHNSASEYQQKNSNVHDHITMQLNKPQQLCKNDLDQTQSSGFISQTPPGNPQQWATGSFSHQLPQDGQHMQADPQPQGVSQSQTDEPILKRLKMESCLDSESQMLLVAYKTPQDYKTMRDNSTFSDPSKSNVQLLSNEVQATQGDAAQIQQNFQQKIQCSQSTSKQHQNYQHTGHHSDMEFIQSSHSQDAQADLQKHAALRMHLLQKQERQGPSHIRPSMQVLKIENPCFKAPVQDQDNTKIIPVIKKEAHALECEKSQQRSILATMEQQLKQYQLSSVFERKSLVIKSPNKVKVEMSGGVTVLSTSTEGNIKEQSKTNFTPTKKIENGLHSFLESPMKLLNTPIKNLIDTPLKTQYDIPSCHCVDQISEKDGGPYYTHLGAASTVPGIREIMEKRSGWTGSAIRIEKVIYTGKEGKSSQGCPIAKWVIRRASVDEKLLVLVRERNGHSCETSCIVVVIIIWEGIQTNLADSLYSELSETLTKHGTLTNRRCAHNEEKTCACQGFEPDACGASFSFGCSWSMYYNGCKFARSKVPRKFKLAGDDPREEEKMEQNLQGLATLMAPVYKQMAPDAYANQVEHEHRAPDCRLGLKEGRPFSGVTACLDFCAHAHRDLHNMQGGSTVVCTLTREDNREIGKIPEDEQLHVLPLYKASSTDEFGSAEAQLEKTKTGAIQVLSAFRRQVRMLAEPAKSCRQRKLDAKKAAANKSSNPNTPNSKMDYTQQAKQKQSVNENPGNTKKNPDPGQPPKAHLAHQPQQQQQHQQPTHPNPTPPYNGPPFPRLSNAQVTLPNTSNMHPQTPCPTGPYLPPINVPNSYINTSNPYSRSLTPNAIYPGYRPNGGLPMDNYNPYYSTNIKQMDMYQPQRNSLYPDQQYSSASQHYGVNYPPHYGEPRMPVNGYSTCNVRPDMHSMGHYRGYSPNMPPDAFSRPPSAPPHLDYAAVGNKNQFEAYSKPHMSQNHQMFPPNLETISMQSSNHLEMNLHGANGISQAFPPLGNVSVNPNQPQSLKISNENPFNHQIKQEPHSVTLEQEEEKEVWSDSEHNFLDPEIGGVAVAPSHGSIIIECAKRELHATTPLKKPDRNHPTRISLVFYQHKNLNEAKHGLALWEAKMAEKAREKEEDAEKHGAENTPNKSSGKKVKREHAEPSEPTEPPYKQFVLMLNGRSMSCTTNTYVNTAPFAYTKVTGPYNHFQ